MDKRSIEKLKNNRSLIIWSSLGIFLVSMIIYLRMQGRLWIASSGKMYFWIGDAYSPDNSQHFLDPYSLSHLLHGVIFFFILRFLFGKFSLQSRFTASAILEGCWEMLENSKMIIDRYREATAALGYTGDTIYNSIGDIFSCSIGFLIARYVGWKWSIVIFVVVEMFCLWWIKDNLTLNVLMLIYPLDSIKEWQLG